MPESHPLDHVRERDDRLARARRRLAPTARRRALGGRCERRQAELAGFGGELERGLRGLLELTPGLGVLDRIDALAERDDEAVEPLERRIVAEQGADGTLGRRLHALLIGCSEWTLYRRLAAVAYDPQMAGARKPSNYSVLFTYVLPYFLYVGVLSVPAETLPRAWAYALALAASGGALVWGWRWYVPLRGPRNPVGSALAGVGAGVAGVALWVAIKRPFFPVEGSPWQPLPFWLRLVASGTVVALFEELLFRGLVLRTALQWDEARRAGSREALAEALHERSPFGVSPGAWSPAALLVSSIAFAAGHLPGEWPAAFVYGLLMAGLWIWRGDLLSCVVAHGTTNVVLAVWVRATGQWALW